MQRGLLGGRGFIILGARDNEGCYIGFFVVLLLSMSFSSLFPSSTLSFPPLPQTSFLSLLFLISLPSSSSLASYLSFSHLAFPHHLLPCILLL